MLAIRQLNHSSKPLGALSSGITESIACTSTSTGRRPRTGANEAATLGGLFDEVVIEYEVDKPLAVDGVDEYVR